MRVGECGLALHGNKVAGSAGFDLADENPACEGNAWSGNRFESANQPCIR